MQNDMDEFLKHEDVYTVQHERDIASEFQRLKGDCYLDHAGAMLYSEKQIQHVLSDLQTQILGNPHSMNTSGKIAEDAIDIVRYSILDHFNTNNEEYSVIFTSGATGALKLVGETFDYGEHTKGTFAYLENNHTSVLGMRSFAERTTMLRTNDVIESVSTVESSNDDEDNNSLFVYPAQCNFSGSKYPLDWIKSIQKGCLNKLLKAKSKNWYVMLDCASYVSTNPLDLSRYHPDFLCISFYKLFGYPSGLGALLVRNSSENLLRKKYFGGGTVLMALASRNMMIPRNILHERFEDGTLPFLSIISLKHGFDTIRRLNLDFSLISRHTFALAQYVFRNLATMYHYNDQAVAVLYNDSEYNSVEYQGGIVNFGLLRSNGEHVGYSEVLHMANLHGIHLRTGCFCNPGACQRFLKLEPTDIIKQFNEGHVCGDQHDLVDGYPTGSVRISFGYMSTKQDADTFLRMVETCFVSTPLIRKFPVNWCKIEQQEKLVSVERKGCKPTGIKTLQKVFVYPIKSCGSLAVSSSWELTPKGLKYDREWMIINSNGVCLTQKRSKKLCLIKPKINLETNKLKLSFKGQVDIEVDLEQKTVDKQGVYLCQSKVCKDIVQGWDCGDEISVWLSNCLEMPGLRLLKQHQPEEYAVPKLSFANKAQYLLINTSSVQWLIEKIPKEDLDENLLSLVERFRPNFLVDLGEAFAENEIDEYLFDGIRFKAAGKCTRCQMICIDQASGEASKEPLRTLSKEFKGKINFGIYLNQDENSSKCVINIGSRIQTG